MLIWLKLHESQVLMAGNWEQGQDYVCDVIKNTSRIYRDFLLVTLNLTMSTKMRKLSYQLMVWIYDKWSLSWTKHNVIQFWINLYQNYHKFPLVLKWQGIFSVVGELPQSIPGITMPFGRKVDFCVESRDQNTLFFEISQGKYAIVVDGY